MSTITEVSDGEGGGHRDVISLEVGDEVYAFEKYIPRGKEVEGVWYRGCVDPTAFHDNDRQTEHPHLDMLYAQLVDHLL